MNLKSCQSKKLLTAIKQKTDYKHIEVSSIDMSQSPRPREPVQTETGSDLPKVAQFMSCAVPPYSCPSAESRTDVIEHTHPCIYSASCVQGLESAVRRIDKYFPNAKGVVKFSAPLAHLITAGAGHAPCHADSGHVPAVCTRCPCCLAIHTDPLACSLT